MTTLDRLLDLIDDLLPALLVLFVGALLVRTVTRLQDQVHKYRSAAGMYQIALHQIRSYATNSATYLPWHQIDPVIEVGDNYTDGGIFTIIDGLPTEPTQGETENRLVG